ncbi:hypothetical protein B0T21DRAFT_386716 [Apiosordaria backusii]|uniref:Uncharacterized protein n=1 Tax=Apiosordaria backusii TaxID=314023 RepID=A0AA40DYN0_9PEZI|nr:hypothetical protein B0T21DRAFT_386716 [Apiosordaria backusii]
MCGGRHYSEWRGTWEGEPRKIPGAGALFPEGYEPLVGDPDPWICPIRDCQTVFPESWALGGHFSASHRALLLNDNRDGTMSIVGKRQLPDPGSGRMPALVISRKPLDPATAPPKAPHRKPRRKKKMENRPLISGMTPRKPKATSVPAPTPAPALSDMSLPRSKSFLVIDLPSNRSSRHVFSPKNYSQALFQPENKCVRQTGTESGKALNARAKNDSNRDSGSSGGSRSDESIAHTPIRGQAQGDPKDVPAVLLAARAQLIRNTPASKRRSRRLAGPESSPQSAQQISKRPAEAVSQSGKPARKKAASSTSKRPKAASRLTSGSSRRSEGGSSSSLPSSSQGAIPHLTMSDWEIAPGRIRAVAGDESDSKRNLFYL